MEKIKSSGLVSVLSGIEEFAATSSGRYRIDGRVALLVQGLDIGRNDLDLRCTRDFVENFQEKYAEHIVESDYDASKHKHYVIANIDEIEVEAAWYDGNDQWDRFEETCLAEWNGISLPVLVPETMLEFYQWLNAASKVDMIKNLLERN